MDSQSKRSVDDYIAGFPESVREILEKLRQVIHEAAPDAQETVSYGMPAFKLKRILVYFAAWKDHIGLYGVSSAVNQFKNDLAPYKQSKGTIKFPLGQPIPYELIKKIVQYRANEESGKK